MKQFLKSYRGLLIFPALLLGPWLVMWAVYGLGAFVFWFFSLLPWPVSFNHL